MTQPIMRRDSSLNALFPPTRQAILAATLVRPEKAWYTSELARHLKLTPSSLQRELKALVSAGILRVQRQGRMGFFQANTESPIYPELHKLLLKTSGLVDVLRESLAPAVGEIQLAFVYGSMANGTAAHESDIDLMIVGSVPPPWLSTLAADASGKLGRPVNPTTYSPAEFQAKRAAGHHFLTSVLDKPKLFVIGTERDVDQTAGR